MEYKTRELTKEEGEALNKDLLELLEKHNAEIGVISHIQILKREEVILSPLTNGEPSDTTEETPKTD